MGIVYIMVPELWILSVCDTEPDQGRYGLMPVTQRSGPQRWLGITEGLPKFINLCDSIRDDEDSPLVMTLFIRSDFQIAELCGTPGWMLHEFSGLWEQFINKGHEIGWHPHLWRWSEKIGSWYQEMFDAKWIKEQCLNPGFADFKRQLPVNISRMGWCYHNNITMSFMDTLGIEADFSGLAGLVSGIRDGRALRSFDISDWSLTPDYAYYPSMVDYRRPARYGEDSLSILEVPQNTLRLSTSLRIGRIVKTLLRGKPIDASTRLMINMYSHNSYLVRIFVEQHLTRARSEMHPVILSWPIHADDLLLEVNLHTFRRNMDLLKNTAKQFKVKLGFKTATQVIKHIKNASI
jgi:hypothetical protein